MLHFRAGSQVWQLITLLSVVGKFPFRSLGLLGNERVLKALVSKLSPPQTIRNPQTETEMTCRILTVTGKGDSKTVRLYKAALPILDWLHPEAYWYYMEAFWNHRFPGDSAHRERNHRVSEAVMLYMRAGVETRPYLLSHLQNEGRFSVIPEGSSFYLARDIKKIGQTEMNKTMFTRMVGAIFSHGNCYAVYNTRAAAMKWSGMGEFKVLHNLAEENMGLVHQVIKDKIHGYGQWGFYTYDDLFQIGCIGLCKAAAADKGGTFSTYAYRLI